MLPWLKDWCPGTAKMNSDALAAARLPGRGNNRLIDQQSQVTKKFYEARGKAQLLS